MTRVSDRVHVVGAGLAGLSAAIWLMRSGRPLSLYEAAGHAGGRCRSFRDETLGRRIDNGNHLVLSGNEAVNDYLSAIGATDQLSGPARAEFPFVDLNSGERWTVRPSPGPIPWWILSPKRRVPGSRFTDYLRAIALARADASATVQDSLGAVAGGDVLYRRFWEPLTVAALNTDPTEAAACLLWPVLRETFARGEAACRPRIARNGLSACFVDPGVGALQAGGTELRFYRRLRSIGIDDGRVHVLTFNDGDVVHLSPGEAVVLAVPADAAAALLPGLITPRSARTIVNGHFLLPEAVPEVRFFGIVGGLCQWLFLRDDVASVTISAADDLAGESVRDLAERMWKEISAILGTGGGSLPAWRVVKEKRATFAQTPEEVARRPGAATPWRNLFLAGDWTNTGLPATIEGTLRSGRAAAQSVLAAAIDA
jgi:squalene-associated FAD-dependent desaturase